MGRQVSVKLPASLAERGSVEIFGKFGGSTGTRAGGLAVEQGEQPWSPFPQSQLKEGQARPLPHLCEARLFPAVPVSGDLSLEIAA